MSDQYWHMGGASGLVVRSAIRTLQFITAVIVAALYGVDLHHSSSTNSPAPSAWVYAEVVAALSIITCAVHCLVTVKRVAWCTWDWVVFILWIAQFGVFGTIYIGKEKNDLRDMTQSIDRMKVAVWFDLICALLWFASAVSAIVWCCTRRRVTRRTDIEEEGVQETGIQNVPSYDPPQYLEDDEDKTLEEKDDSLAGGSMSSTLNGEDDSLHKGKKGFAEV